MSEGFVLGNFSLRSTNTLLVAHAHTHTHTNARLPPAPYMPPLPSMESWTLTTAYTCISVNHRKYQPPVFKSIQIVGPITPTPTSKYNTLFHQTWRTLFPNLEASIWKLTSRKPTKYIIASSKAFLSGFNVTVETATATGQLFAVEQKDSFVSTAPKNCEPTPTTKSNHAWELIYGTQTRWPLFDDNTRPWHPHYRD